MPNSLPTLITQNGQNKEATISHSLQLNKESIYQKIKIKESINYGRVTRPI